MLRYNEYSDKHIPIVHFGIHDEILNEALEARHFLGFVGSFDNYPQNKGYKLHYGNHIYTNENHPGKFFHFAGTHQPKMFNSLDHALDYDYTEREQQEHAIDSLSDHLIDHYSANKLSSNEQSAISSYTSPNSSINSRILKGSTVDLDHEKMHHIDTALAKSKTPGDLVVYTGTDKDHSSILARKSIVKHPAYLSASLSLRKAKAFAESKDGSVIAIHIPSGHAGMYIQHISRIPSEREFLLPRGLVLHIDHDKNERISGDKNTWTRLHHAHIVDPTTIK